MSALSKFSFFLSKFFSDASPAISRHFFLNASRMAASASALLVTACGGGSSTSTPTPPQTPVTTAALQAIAPTAPRFAVALDDLESVGPFASWANAKRDYGAVGNGVADDTAALQRALNDLGQPGKAGVLFLPAGNYRITSSLNLGTTALTGGFGWGGVGIVGDSPATTRITWAGPAGGAMLIQNGGYNTRYSRITWDGKGTAGYGIAHWWNTKSPGVFDGSSEDVDEVFQDMGIGIMAGRMGTNYGQLNSEGQVRRVTFLRNTVAGVNTGSYNALDWWVFDSHFVDCARGLTNNFSINDAGATLGAGGFYVYRSVFERSTVADISVTTNGWFSMHQNVSIGSRRFFQSEIIGPNPAPTIIKGNRIVNTTDQTAIVSGNQGPLMLIDNLIRSTAGATAPAVMVNNWAAGRDVLSVGNQYTVNIPIKTVDNTDRLITFGDTFPVAASSITAAVPSLPGTAQRISKPVFEVPSNASSAQIQSIILQAASASGSTGAIVHFPPGQFVLKSTLVVPALTRVQLVGDGLTSVILWGGSTASGTLLRMQGPSLATVRDLLLLNGSTTTPAIVVEKANQAGGRVLLEGNSIGPLVASNLTQTQLSLQANPGIASLTLTNVQNHVQIGTGVQGPVKLTANSSALLADTWYEGTESHLFRIDSGTLTYMGGQMSPASHAGATQPNDPAVHLTGLKGTVSFIGVQLDLAGVPSGIGLQVDSETADTNALFLGITSHNSGYFKRTSSGGNVGFLQSKAPDALGVNANTPELGNNSSAFLEKMLTQARSLTWDTTPYIAPTGATDVRIYRTSTNQAGGIQILGE